MLSFELSAIDLILAIAVIILLVLYLTKSSAKPPSQEKILVKKESSSREPVIEATMPEATVPEDEIESSTSSQPQPKTDSATCPFGFGYLRKLDKDASIPDGCLGCSRIVECYSAGE